MQSPNDILSNYSNKQDKNDIDDIKKDENYNNSKHQIDQDNIPSSSFEEKLWGGSSSVSEVSMSDDLSSTESSSNEEEIKKKNKKRESLKLENREETSKLKKKKKKYERSSSLSSSLDFSDSDDEIVSKKKINKDKIKKIDEYSDLPKKKKNIDSHEKKIKKNIYTDDSDNTTLNEFEIPKRRGRPRKKKIENNKLKNKYHQTYSSYTSDDDDMSSIHYNTGHKKQNKNISDIHQLATVNRFNKKQNQEKMLFLGDNKKRKHILISQINVSDRSGQTPIFKYAKKGDIEACQALINAGADLNIKENAGYTPLHEACLNGEYEIVKLMIRYGADINACAQNLDTPLHDAAENRHIDVVEYLLANGAILNAKNEKGLTPIEAVSGKFDDVRDVLLKWEKMLKKIEEVDDTGQTVLHHSAEDGNLEHLQEYLKYGANVNVTDYAGWTPLHEACLSGHYKCAEELLLHGADLNIPGPDGDYPLHEASYNGHKKVIELLLSFGANPDQINEKTQKTPKDLARNSECLKLLNEDPSKYKPYRKSRYAITYIAPLDTSGHIDYNHSSNPRPGFDHNVMYSAASSDTSHTLTTYQRGGGTWTNASGGIRIPESTNSVSIDGGNYFSSSREARKFKALLHQFDEIDKKEKKRKHNSEHREVGKVKKKLKSLTSIENKEKIDKVEKMVKNEEEKPTEKLHKNNLKDIKYDSDKEERIKSIKKKKEKLKHDGNTIIKKEIDKTVDVNELPKKDKEKLKQLQEKHKALKSKHKSNDQDKSTTEEKIKKSTTKEKIKEIMNMNNVDKNDNNKIIKNENKDNNNENKNSKSHRSAENHAEIDDEEPIDIVETANPIYSEEPIIDNDDILLSSDLGLMYTRQRSTRKNINYDLTSETSTPQLSPTAQHSIGDYDMSWAEDMSFLKTIKEDETDGDWLDSSKRSGSTGSRRKRRSTKSNDTDEKTKSNENSGSKKLKSDKSSKSVENPVKRRKLVSGSGHSVSEASSHHSHHIKSEKDDQESSSTINSSKLHKSSKKDKEKLKEKIKEKEKDSERKREGEKDKEVDINIEKGKEMEIEIKKEKEKEKEKERKKDKDKDKDSNNTKSNTSKKKAKKWNFLGISGYQRVNNNNDENINEGDSKDNIKVEKDISSETKPNNTNEKVKTEENLVNDESINLIKTENDNKYIKTEIPLVKIKSVPIDDNNNVEIKATIIPVNDEVTKSKYKTYLPEDSYMDSIKPEINEMEEFQQKKSRAQIKQENKERKLTELKRQSQSESQPKFSDDTVKMEKQKTDHESSPYSFNNRKNIDSDEMLKTPSPKIEKNMNPPSSYSNSPSSISTPSVIPFLDIENMTSKFRAEDMIERKFIKSIITNYRKCRCLPLYSFKLPAQENITNLLLASQGQKFNPKKKEENNNNIRYVTDIQIGLFLGYKSGRELLDKYPTLKRRVATLAEKERLENSPISDLIVDCLLSANESNKWSRFEKQLKLTDLDIQFLKLDEVMNMVIKHEHFDQILKDEVDEVSLKISKAAGERFKSQQNGYVETCLSSGHAHPFNISNKMMLLTIDVDLLSFSRDQSSMNKANTSKYNIYHPPSSNNSVSHSESTTPNNIKFNKNDTPYRNGFKKSFIKYQQQLSSLALNNNNTNEKSDDFKPHQSSYHKSNTKTIHHPPIQMNKPDLSSSPMTSNTSPIQSPSNTSSYYTRDYNVISHLQQPLLPSTADLKSSMNNNNTPGKIEKTPSTTTVKTFTHKIEKIHKALPLKAKFKLATKENQ